VRRIEFAFLLTGLVSLILVSLYGCHQQDHASSSATVPVRTTITALIWAPDWPEEMLQIAAEFSKQFAGATNVNWDKIGTVSFAQFHLQKDLVIAYFDADANLIARGRKISEAQLPMKV